jgi:hypothetical protein
VELDGELKVNGRWGVEVKVDGRQKVNGKQRRVGDQHATGGIEAPTDIKCIAEGAYVMYCDSS